MIGKLNSAEFSWINRPEEFSLENGRITLFTNPETDFWQRTYYGFRNDNGHLFIKGIEGDFTFVLKTTFEPVSQYDQCGVILYQDSENWVKGSVEYENNDFARLGSVVTNLGFSDWASMDISAAVTSMWYRFSRKGQDFRLENSMDGLSYSQMRIFHLHKPVQVAQVGVYACSPMKSSFKAIFSDFELGKCLWPDHHGN